MTEARSRALVLFALVLTALAGVGMRWGLAGHLPMPWDFTRLRHAHAHLAYYGVLVPLAWWVWRARGIALPSAGWLWAYGVAVVVAIAGFLRAGYAVEAIAGSTAVGGVWLFSAWRARARMRVLDDPLGALLPGMVLALACVPFVARTTRRDPAMAQLWVATFLAAMLLLVIVPSCLAALGVRRPWPGLLATGALGAAALGVWATAPARLGLMLFGALVWPVGWRAPAHVRAMWALLALGVGGLAVGLVPNVRPVVIAAVHFLALSVCLPVLLRPLGVPLAHRGWWVHHAAVGLLCAPVALQAWGAGPWTFTAAAAGGSLVLVELLALGAWLGLGGGEPAATSGR